MSEKPPVEYIAERFTALCAEWFRTGNPLFQPEILRVWRALRLAQEASGLRSAPFLVLLP